jgi:hypothetical protein
LELIVRIIGQLLTIFVFVFSGVGLFHFRLPGNHSFTDNDLAVSAILYAIFFMTGIGLIVNSFFFIIKSHWKKYRVGVLAFVFGCILAIVVPRQFIFWIAFGKQESEFVTVDVDNSSDVMIQLKLFKNNKFVSTSTNFHLTKENIGTYIKSDTLLRLTFPNEKSQLIGTKFKIQNDTLYCEDCSSEITLIKDN